VKTFGDDRGFALVITLTLVALLVLAVFALSTLGRVNSRIAAVSLQQTQARQNALLALEVALGELQRHAGPDARITGMAGVGGESPQSSFRQWTGVWGGSPSPVWLVSGANPATTPSLNGTRLVIVGTHSVGAPTDRTDQELVEVGLVDLPGLQASGISARTGRMGYWVGDEGVKVSAIIANDELQPSGLSGWGIRPNFQILIGGAFNPGAALNSRYISLEQLQTGVTGFSLFKAFHSLTRSHQALSSTASGGSPKPGDYVVGAFNINTTSESAWRALLEFPDSASSTSSVFALTTDRARTAARQIRDHIAVRAIPFSSVAELRNSNIIQASFDNASPKIITPTQDEFFDELAPILTTRSDTFRIRGYGDVLDAVDSITVKTSTFCEAIVQRTPELMPDSSGHRFIVTYFRWLGPDDI
jgi:hypothetical protein